MTDKGVQFCANGGVFNGKIPMYANGTNNPSHGSLFVAGENGAEMVGHINNRTEVLNRFQLASVMQSSIIAGMSQFTEYWRAIYSQMTVCANGVINSVLVTADAMATSMDNSTTYDPTNALAQSVYEDSQRAYDNSFSADMLSTSMGDFYREYVEPTLKEIASDTKRQADKEEQTIVQVGNRTINDAVTKQQKANGYKFAT
jgi:hypothetical protein